MRLSTASLLVACISVGFTGIAAMTPAQAQWTEAKIPDEQQRTVQGCAAEARNPGDWVCVMVRCDQPGSPPSLHFSTPDADIRGNIKLTIDNQSFALSVTDSPKSPLPWSTRAQSVPPGLLEAMMAGSALSIEGAKLEPPYNRISLQSSRQAIERVEWMCAGGAPMLNAASILRRIRRGMFF
jgi:hypothetical protein